MSVMLHTARSPARRFSTAALAFVTSLCFAQTATAAPPTRRPSTPGTTAPPTVTPPGLTPPSSVPRSPGIIPGGPGAPELSGDENGANGHNFCKRQPRGAKFRITLPKEAELEDLVNWMMSVSCQKFIWDPKIRGTKVTILSPEPVTIEEAYAAFYASLHTMGFTVEPSGSYFKIVESNDAKARTLPVYGPAGAAPNNDRFVTQLVRIKTGNTKDVVDVLTKLKSKQGSVDQVGELIILTDTGSNVRRMMKIVRQIDDPAVSGERVFFFQLQYANPEETAETIREIFGEGNKSKAAPRNTRNTRNTRNNAAADTGGFSRVIVDDRTGTLMIIASEGDYQVIRKLIEKLDVPLAGGGGRIHVRKLRNADPEEVATVLTQLGSGAQAQQQAGNARGARGARGANQPATPAKQGGVTAELFSGDIKVTADPATRSLVILASNSDYRALEEVIDQLDSERKQVYLEVYLLELNIDKVMSGGAMGHFGSGFDTSGGSGLGFVASAPQGPATNSLVLSPSVLSGLAAGVLGPQIPNSGNLLGTGQDVPAFGVIIQALQQDTDVNFVAEPHLYTADNQEASISVGRNVPTPGALSFPGGGQGGGLVPVQSIQRQDVSLNLKVTPHINDDKMVSLDIEMENNDIESIDPVRGVTTTKRQLKLTQVVARDDQPVVLGGLVQEVEREAVSQVPGLGSIPLLGWLFKNKRRQRTKVNLLMVLVPHILQTPDDARRIHERRMKERMEFLERYTAFKRRDLETNINYRKKSGLLAALNTESLRMADEEVFRRQADLELETHEITGDLGLSPQVATDDDATETQAPQQAKPPSSRRRRGNRSANTGGNSTVP